MVVIPVRTALAGALIMLCSLSACADADAGPTSPPAVASAAPASSSPAPSPAAKPTPEPTAVAEPVNPAVRFQGAYAYREVVSKSNTRSYAKVGTKSKDSWTVDTSCAKTCVSRVTGSDGSVRLLRYAKKKWTWSGTYESGCVNAATGKATGKKVKSKVTLTLATDKIENGLIDRLRGTVTDYQVTRCTGGTSTLVKVKYTVTVQRRS